MNKILFLLILSMPMLTFGFSNAPEQTPLSPLVQFEFYDRSINTIYYETIPILNKSKHQGFVSLQPFISKNVISGETQFQMWFSFFPIINDFGHPETIKPTSITISSLTRELSIPILFKHSQRSKDDLRYVPRKISKTEERGYLYLFPEDVSNLQLLILDLGSAPIEPWEPQKAMERIQSFEESLINYDPSFSKMQEYTNYYDNNLISNKYSYDILHNQLLSPASNDPILLQQKSVSIIVKGELGTLVWDVSATHLYNLTEAISLYFQLEKTSVRY